LRRARMLSNLFSSVYCGKTANSCELFPGGTQGRGLAIKRTTR
jgi:hypothetical protein